MEKENIINRNSGSVQNVLNVNNFPLCIETTKYSSIKILRTSFNSTIFFLNSHLPKPIYYCLATKVPDISP